jgi:hypothetical protein
MHLYEWNYAVAHLFRRRRASVEGLNAHLEVIRVKCTHQLNTYGRVCQVLLVSVAHVSLGHRDVNLLAGRITLAPLALCSQVNNMELTYHNTEIGLLLSHHGKLLHKRHFAGSRWLRPVILATWEAESRRIVVQSQPSGENSLWDPILKVPNTKKGW